MNYDQKTPAWQGADSSIGYLHQSKLQKSPPQQQSYTDASPAYAPQVASASQPAPLGIFTTLCATQPTTLTFRGEVMSRSFTITDRATAQPVFRVAAKSMSLSHQATLLDASGTPVFTLKKENWKMGPRVYYAVPGGADGPDTGERLFEIQLKFSFGKSKATAVFNNVAGARATGGAAAQESLSIKAAGVFSSGSIVDERTGRQVGGIESESFHMHRTYHLDVAQGMDMGIAVAIVIALDDKARDNNAGAAGAGAGGGGA